MNRSPAIRNKVRQAISRHDMIRPGDRVVVAVSGGPDSVCLLNLLHELRAELKMDLVVAHFNHGLRPEEDDGETRFVESLAASLNHPFVAQKAAPFKGPAGGSLEERAREARYRFLEEVQGRYSAHKIALGHHLNDQAETVLMRLLRGSGPSGLAGIPPCRGGKIIRPLIDVTRAEIVTYLETGGLNYITDPSNLDQRYLRNRVRLELLPLLETYQPRIAELLGRTARILATEDQWLDAWVSKWAEQHMETQIDGAIWFPLRAFLDLPEGFRNRVIRYGLKQVGGGLRRVGMRHIRSITDMATSRRPQGRVDLPNGIVAKRVYGRIGFLCLEMTPLGSFKYVLGGLGSHQVDALGCCVTVEEVDQGEPPQTEISKWTAFFDRDRLADPLLLRDVQPGDRFVPLGMKGHKKLKDFFIDLKLPLEARRRVPLLISRNEIVWVCGLRMDDRFKVTSETRNILRVEFTGLTFGSGP